MFSAPSICWLMGDVALGGKSLEDPCTIPFYSPSLLYWGIWYTHSYNIGLQLMILVCPYYELGLSLSSHLYGNGILDAPGNLRSIFRINTKINGNK